ncbi:MAG TPA: hypothetical protein VMT03_01445 [Polyangia bacterium]|nr:hypothetical protein [Polyangia bacterium]
MSIVPSRARLRASVLLGAVTLGTVVLLLVWDTHPERFPNHAHDWLGAVPLAAIAVAYLVYQSAGRPSPAEWLRAGLLALAFLLWAGNQLWPDSARATLLNDLAIGLFVLDVFFAIVAWPAVKKTRIDGRRQVR